MKPNFVVVTTPGLRGRPGLNGIPAPLWAWPNNHIGEISSIIAENVVDARQIPAADLEGDNVIEGVILAHIPEASGNGKKYLRVCIAGSVEDSLVLELEADQFGEVEIQYHVAIKLASPHVLWVRYYLGDRVNVSGRMEFVANVAVDPIELQTRAWVEDDQDIIVVDSTTCRLSGSGRA